MFRSRTALHWMYLSSFIFTFHVVLPVFINSTFLSGFWGSEYVGIIYSLGSFITIIGLLLLPRVIRIFGTYNTTITLIVAEMLALSLIAATSSIIITTVAFLLHFLLSTLIALNLDIILENHTPNEEAGETRGIYLSFANVAWLGAPFVGGLLLSIGNGNNYFFVYGAASIFLFPLLGLLLFQFRNFKDENQEVASLFNGIKNIFLNNDKRNIFISNFILRLFFAWMVVYTPIYLIEHIGFSFQQTGIIFSFIMLAYLLFEWPLGRMADDYIGEKELLIAGFIVLSITTIFLSFLTEANIYIWITALFLTRIGAAMVEITTESYFFKKVTGLDTGDIGFWRITRPVGYLVAPLLASLFLSTWPFQYIFIAIGTVMLAGIPFALLIHDTK